MLIIDEPVKIMENVTRFFIDSDGSHAVTTDGKVVSWGGIGNYSINPDIIKHVAKPENQWMADATEIFTHPNYPARLIQFEDGKLVFQQDAYQQEDEYEPNLKAFSFTSDMTLLGEGKKISSWAEPLVAKAVASGYVPADLQSNYTSNITRQEFCHLAITTYEKVTGTIVSGRAKFNDTTDEFVEKAGYLEIIAGVGDGSFAPNSTLTREQAAVILTALASKMGKPIPASVANFADSSSISNWAAAQVGQVQSAGIMNGVADNRFSPKTTYTREQSIATIVSLVNYISEK
jgi:hypothetical protein